MNEPSDPISFLPFDIQTLLKRKSSRDPSSRFTAKLHRLLAYVDLHKNLADTIGCAWDSEDEFRLNKRTIVGIMGIKINTLNVNLHQLGFIQQKHNKDGWTLWKKNGFTRSSADYIDSAVSMTGKKSSSNFTPSFKLGKVNPQQSELFIENCKNIWMAMLNVDDKPVPTHKFIEKAAMRFKQNEQPIENAQDVIKAIIAPVPSQDTISFNMFCKFMAMFGPEHTIMLKIASLLSCSNSTGQWLNFDPNPTSSSFYATFRDSEPNCLVLNRKHSEPECIWNLPHIEATNNSKYIVDADDKYYSTWEDYFHFHPPQDNSYNPDFQY